MNFVVHFAGLMPHHDDVIASVIMAPHFNDHIVKLEQFTVCFLLI